MKRHSLLVVLLFLVCFPLLSQTKAESRLYDKVMAAGDIRSFDKFLAKYPKSVFAPLIRARKDTLLSVSPYSVADAETIAGPFTGENAKYRAFAYRKDAVDYVEAVVIEADSLDKGDIRIISLVRNGAGWSVRSSDEQSLARDREVCSVVFVDSCRFAGIGGNRCFLCSFLMELEGSDRRNLYSVAYCPETGEFRQSCFSGRSVLKPGETGYRIEGRIRSMDSDKSPVISVLEKCLADNPRLVVIPEADYYTDEVIAFWLENNDGASSRISAPEISDGCSLIGLFDKAGKENGAKFSAALFDCRGYTVIVARQKSTGKHILAWAEKQCSDRNRDRFLNGISFRNGDSLEMYYYQGRRYFKYIYNLASKEIRR